MGADWYVRMEKDLRRFGGELPIDAFLPDLDPAAQPEAAPEPPEPAQVAVDWQPGVPICDQEKSVVPDSVPEPPRAPTAPAEDPDLDAEIREWMSKDQRGAADENDEDDLADFLGPGMDPNVD